MKKFFALILTAAMAFCMFSYNLLAESELDIDFDNAASMDENSALASRFAVHSAHGYGDKTSILLGYDHQFYLGTIDLSKYSSAKIVYATDLSYLAVSSGSGVTGALGFKSQRGAFGWDANDFNFENSIAYANTVDASTTNPDGSNWDKTERTADVDLSSVDYRGPVYLSAYNPTNQEILILSITFTSSEGNPGTSDFSNASIYSFIIAAAIALALIKRRRTEA